MPKNGKDADFPSRHGRNPAAWFDLSVWMGQIQILCEVVPKPGEWAPGLGRGRKTRMAVGLRFRGFLAGIVDKCNK
jgi:hypothetical protein